MNIALITISSLSLLVSAATLTIVFVGGKKAKDEIDSTKVKANNAVRRMQMALEELEL